MLLLKVTVLLPAVVAVAFWVGGAVAFTVRVPVPMLATKFVPPE
jgi:hypothetical protein